jgi:Spy/CpxP family protein refolding chaperone
MKKTLCSIATLIFCLPFTSLPSFAQFQVQLGQPQTPGGQPKQGLNWNRRGPGVGREGMGMGGGYGTWWKSPEITQQLSLTDDQQQKIDRTFQDYRLKLIDLHAELEKQEALLQPLVDADHPDEAKVMAQVDKVTQARAALEKSNASMMLAIRRVLTSDQWKKLQEHSPSRRHDFDGPGGPPSHRPDGEPPKGDIGED